MLAASIIHISQSYRQNEHLVAPKLNDIVVEDIDHVVDFYNG
jgi:hypothetical protein